MNWEGLLQSPANPQDLAVKGNSGLLEMQVELDFAHDHIQTLEHKLKTAMLSNLTLREETEKLTEVLNTRQQKSFSVQALRQPF